MSEDFPPQWVRFNTPSLQTPSSFAIINNAKVDCCADSTYKEYKDTRDTTVKMVPINDKENAKKVLKKKREKPWYQSQKRSRW